MCLGFLSDLPWGGSKAGQEGVKESFKDKRLYWECCHSGSGFGQILWIQGGTKKVEECIFHWRNPPSDQMFTATYWCIADDTVDTRIYLHPVILVVFFWPNCLLLAIRWAIKDPCASSLAVFSIWRTEIKQKALLGMLPFW